MPFRQLTSSALLSRLGAAAVLIFVGSMAFGGGADQKLAASDAASGDRLGAAVAVDLDTTILGAPGESQDRGAAYVYVRLGGSFAEQAKLTASDGAADDAFGWSVGIHGDTAVVGALGDDAYRGAAYVFVRTRGVWTQQAKLIAGDAEAGDWFGTSVAVNGDTIVVGARHDDDGGSSSGSAYVFVRSGGAWTQQGKLTASDAEGHAEFGWSVAVIGETAVIGAHGHDSSAGAAYVFGRSGGAWGEVDKLTAGDGAGGDGFGYSVAISPSGRAILVGAPGDADHGASSGSAYFFFLSGGVWSEQSKLTSADAEAGDWFGRSVAIRKGVAVVGASSADGPPGDAPGAAYVFGLLTVGWTEWSKLTPDVAETDGQFGRSVSLSEGTVVVGAWTDDGQGANSGAAYAYRLPTKLEPSDAEPGTFFPVSVATSGDTVLVGWERDGAADSRSGSVWVFARSGSQWPERQKLTASDAAADAFFGTSVAVDGDIAVVGAPGAEEGRGAAYVFVRSDGAWAESARLTPSDAMSWGSVGSFGSSVALEGDTLLVGDHTLGAVYVFVRSGDEWSERQILTPADQQASPKSFGWSLALNGDTAVVGCLADVSNAVYVFVRSGDSWTEQQRLTRPGGLVADYFGRSVALSGDTVVIGAPEYVENWKLYGSAYVFVRSAGVWALQQRLVLPDPVWGDHFGRAVAVQGDTAWVSADHRGSVHVFGRVLGVWTEQRQLAPLDPEPYGQFGWSVAVSGQTAVIGTVGESVTPAWIFSDAVWPPEFGIGRLEFSDSTTGIPHDAQPWTQDGARPVHWSVSAGTLPVTGGIDALTGEIDGVWGVPGVHPFTIEAWDSAGQSVTRSFTPTVHPWPTITTTDLQFAVTGRPHRVPIEVSGGTPALEWAVLSGELPGDMSLDPDTGELVGRPYVSDVGTWEIDVGCTDAVGAAALPQQLSFDVVPIVSVEQMKGTAAIAFDGTDGLSPICRVLELVAGTRLRITVKLPVKGAPLELRLLDGLQREIDLSALIKTRKKSIKVKPFVVPHTERYFLVLTPQGPLDGLVVLQAKVTPPKKAVARLTLAAGEPQNVTVGALNDARVKLVVKAERKSHAVPTILSVIGPAGDELLVAENLKLKKKSASVELDWLRVGGTLTVRIGTRDGTAGAVKCTATIKEPKRYYFRPTDMPVETGP